MAKRKYRKLIKRGRAQSLHHVPFHDKAPLTRFLMQDFGTFPEMGRGTAAANYHIAAHIVRGVSGEVPDYCRSHVHNCDEINLILGGKGELVYEIVLEDEKYTVCSPSTVYIPRGLRHKARVKKGEGTFVAIVMSSNYRSSLVRVAKT